jgi:hypothetical protein
VCGQAWLRGPEFGAVPTEDDKLMRLPAADLFALLFACTSYSVRLACSGDHALASTRALARV